MSKSRRDDAMYIYIPFTLSTSDCLLLDISMVLYYMSTTCHIVFLLLFPCFFCNISIIHSGICRDIWHGMAVYLENCTAYPTRNDIETVYKLIY